MHPPVAVQHGAQLRLIRRLQLHRQLQRRAVFALRLRVHAALEACIARLQCSHKYLVRCGLPVREQQSEVHPSLLCTLDPGIAWTEGCMQAATSSRLTERWDVHGSGGTMRWHRPDVLADLYPTW